MRVTSSSLAALSTLPLFVAGAVKRATPEPFHLYGYNKGSGGLPLFYADGFAYVGDGRGMNHTDNTAFVNFTESNDGTWIATLNATNSTTSLSSTNVTFMVPAAGNFDRRVGFANGTSSPDVVTTGFRFYGSLAAHVGDDGSLETFFTGLQITPGVQALYWNDTSLGQQPIVIRNVAPSNHPN